MTYANDFETGASHLEDFLHATTGTAMDDGSVAQASVQQQLWTPRQHEGTSLDFIEQEGKDLQNGLAELYTAKHSATHLQALGRVLAGAYVITAITPEVALPSVIAVTQDTSSELQLWMWRQPWRASGITEDQTQLLAAAAQLEAPGVGQHRGQQTAGEAQHLLSVLSIAESPSLLQRWSNGQHVNHSPQFRSKGTLPAVSGNLLDEQYQVSSLRLRQNAHRITELSIGGSPYQPAPHTQILWHRDSMQAPTEQGVRVCDSAKALTIVQGAGFMAMRHATDNLQRVIGGDLR